MNQGTTEVMLALGLEDSMVGTAYLDDYIWPAVEEAYNKIPVIGTSYPNITTLLSVDPDFIYASYSSAFATSHLNYSQFVDANEEGECDLVIERKPGEFRSHCRQELNDKGVQTYLQKPACELTEHRPDEGYSTIDTLYDEIWDIASIFNVYDSARNVVDGIEGKRRYLFKLLCCVNIINLILTRNTPISLSLDLSTLHTCFPCCCSWKTGWTSTNQCIMARWLGYRDSICWCMLWIYSNNY